MSKKPEILSTQTIATTRLFNIEQVDLKFSNGTIVQYERLRSSSAGAVLVVPLKDEKTVLMIREYAAGVHRYELALPKGRIEKGETPLEAANREMMEEVGFGSNRLTQVISMTLAPGYFGHITHVILAEELYPQKNEGDEPEEIEVVPWQMDNITALLDHDECTEARSIAALYLVRDILASRASNI